MSKQTRKGTMRKLTIVLLAALVAANVLYMAQGFSREWSAPATVEAHDDDHQDARQRADTRLTLYGGQPKLVDLGYTNFYDTAIFRITHSGNATLSTYVTVWDPDIYGCSGNVNRTGVSDLNVTAGKPAITTLTISGMNSNEQVCFFSPLYVTDLIVDRVFYVK